MASTLNPAKTGTLESRCPECGRPLPLDAPGGLCAACLVRQTMDAVAEPTQSDNDVPQVHTAFLPRAFGDYELLEEIARGGMGVVYRARQRSLNRIVALKMILGGPFASRETILRFRAEAEAAANLHHPNIVAIHETGEADGQHFFSMDYVDGRNLADLVRDGLLPFRKAAGYLAKVAEAIHYAHQHKVLHRDLKPSNVLIDRDDEPRITDFGLAKRLSDTADLTVTGQLLGSPGYMPPEQASKLRGKLGSHSDIYALGAILYHLLTGRPPFQAENLSDILDQLLHRDPVPPRQLNPSVPRDLETVCLKCLEKLPAKRYATARHLAEELRRFLRDEPVLARPAGRAEKVWRWCRRNPVLAGMGLVLALLLIAVGMGSPIALVQISRSRAQARSDAIASRQSLYAADMLLVQESYQQGNVRRAIELLLRHRPKAGEEDLRDFSWRYLWRLCHEGDAMTTAARHTQTVNQIAWSATGLLATAGLDGVVQIYDSVNNKTIASLSPGDEVHAVEFSPDADSLAMGDAMGRVQLWTVNPFERRRSQDFGGPIMALAFSPDGSWLVVSVKELGIKAWALTDNPEIVTVPGSRPAIRLTFSHDGRVLAGGGNAMPVRFWTVPEFRPLASLEEPHSGFSTGVAFSPDGRMLATASWDTMIKLWDFESRTLLATLKGHHSHVWDLDISPDGKTLASASSDGTVKLWQLVTPLAAEIGPWRTLRGHTGPVLSARFDSNGVLLASGSADQSAKLWRVHPAQSPDVLSGHNDWVYSVAISPDGRHLATGSFDRTVRIWDTATLHPLAIMDAHQHNVFTVAFLPDGSRLASCDAVWRVNEHRDFAAPGTVNLWDVATAKLLSSLTEFTTGVRAIAITPDGSTLATGDHDGDVQLWNIQNLPPLALGSLSGTGVTPGNLESARQIGRLQFAPDGKRLAIVRKFHSAEVWNVDPLQPLATFPGEKNWAYALAFSPDGRWLVGGQEEVKIWEIATGKLLSSLKGHEATIMCAAFSSDGITLATGSVDHSVKLWHLAIQQEVATLRGHQGPVSDVVFSRDGSLLLSASEDMTARLWRAAPATALE